jgi:trigger factor
LTKVENTGANKVKLEIEVNNEEFVSALQKAYIKNKGKFNIQGFRRGKAPKAVVENFYGESVFYEDAFELLFPDSYTAVIDELKLVPVSKPEVDIVKIDKKEGVVYTAEFFVKPKVELGEYKGVKAEKEEPHVDEKQIDEELNSLADRNARWVDVEREAKTGDKVIIDYSGSVDGTKFEGGTAESQTLEIGSGMFINGFEEQIVGMKKDDERDIKVTFPEDYRAKDLAGKEAVFQIKLHEVKEKELPEINDEFAQDVSEFETLEEYKNSIRKRLTEGAEEHAKSHTQSNVIEQVVNNTKIDLPECMIENQIDDHIRQIEYSLLYQGVKLEDYLKMTGMKLEDLRKDYRENAEKTVRMQLVIEAVKDAEDIKATDEQIDEEIKKRAERAKKEFEDYKKSLKEEELEYIKEELAYDCTVDFLVDNAVFTAPDKKAKKETKQKENT